MQTLFFIFLGVYVLTKLVFFIGIYIATKQIERKALENKKQYELNNQIVELKELLTEYEKRKEHLEEDKVSYSVRRDRFLE